jgi:hypothetical protein
MKRILTILLVALSPLVFAQKMQIQNMINYLRSKEYEKAKASADAAAVHDETKTSSKMWMNRGNVYKALASDTSQKVKALDPEAEEKALDAYTNCFKYDKDNIYKDDMDAVNSFVLSANRVDRKAVFYRDNKQYDAALKCYDLLDAAIASDSKDFLKKSNITKEKVMIGRLEVYKATGNKEKAKETADKLIDAKYNDAKIYNDMVRLSLDAKDTTQALAYIEKGKVAFPSNMNLITTELDIYLARKKTDVLKDKLNAAIALSPNNEMLHFVLANLYKTTNQFEEAEKEYKKTLELKTDYEPANYNLAVLYYSAAKDWNDKLNALPMKDPKAKEYEAKSNEYFKKAVGYFEASYAVTQDKRTKQILRQICLRLGETEKAEKYK